MIHFSGASPIQTRRNADAKVVLLFLPIVKTRIHRIRHRCRHPVSSVRTISQHHLQRPLHICNTIYVTQAQEATQCTDQVSVSHPERLRSLPQTALARVIPLHLHTPTQFTYLSQRTLCHPLTQSQSAQPRQVPRVRPRPRYQGSRSVSGIPTIPSRRTWISEALNPDYMVATSDIS